MNNSRVNFEGMSVCEVTQLLKEEIKSDFALKDSFNNEMFWWDTALLICKNSLGVLVYFPDFYNLYGLRYFLNDVLANNEMLNQWLIKACKINKNARGEEHYFCKSFKVMDERIKNKSLDCAKAAVTRMVSKCGDNAINMVYTASEAAELWEVGEATVKQACSGQKGYPPRFFPEECRKSKGTWLVSKAGMERLYGLMPCLRSGDNGKDL